VGKKGEQLGVIPFAQALDTARKNNVDLVEVAPNAVPPVCRLLDYGKYKYEQTKKEREARKNQKVSMLREVRFRPSIGEHDLEAKLRSVIKFLDDGDKVKLTIVFRGREITHANIGSKLLKKVVDSLDDKAAVESQPVIDGKRMAMVLAPSTSQKAKVKEEAKKVQDAKVENP
jgi:translation initiation factor IF-3